jgi:predicted nucleic acid-binding protein
MNADFIDTNPFVYLFDETAGAKRTRAEEIVRSGRISGAMISHQVVQETLNVITGKLGASSTDAKRFFRDVLEPFWGSRPTPGLYVRSLDIRQRYGLSFWDSLIVGAALESGCTRLLTEDLQHGQVIEGLAIENPFL